MRETSRKIGVEYDPWQVDLNKAILAKDLSGAYAADTVAISIPRQVGKTYDIGGIVFADCIINPGTTVVWTAHRFKVARETFDSLRGMAKSHLMAPHLDYESITSAAGNECIPFRNGSRIVFAARERGAIRGFTKVRRLILDEAQILSEAALADMIPTMNQADNPQVILMGTPPKPSDPAEVFKAVRREALSGESEGVLYVEFAAPGDSKSDDRDAWRIANPSFPRRTPAKAILRMKKLLSEADFRREALGIWDADQKGSRLITASQWGETGIEPHAVPQGTKSFGVAYSQDGSRVALAGARKHSDGVHVELLDGLSGNAQEGVFELAEWLADHSDDVAQIVISGRAGATVLAEALRNRKVSQKVIHVASTTDYFTACATLLDALRDKSLTHLASDGQAALDMSVSVCDRKARGVGGAWGWAATTPEGDETPLEAISLAHWAARTTKRRPGQRSRVVVLA